MTDTKPALADLRAEIDRIDDQLHDLIMRRSTIIERVRQAKVNDRIKIRPAREADILYRLSSRHQGIFPKQSLFRMWREMIVGTLALEAPFAVAVFSPPDDHSYEDLARDHFGSFSNLQCQETSADVLSMVARDKATVGVLPYPGAGQTDPWWHRLNTSAVPLWIMARLPFFGRSNAKGGALDALVVSAVEPEPSGRDVSVYSFGGDEDHVLAALKRAGLTVLTSFNEGDERPGCYGELDGYVSADDGRLNTVKTISRWLGVYSRPIEEDELTAERKGAHDST